MSDYTSQRSGDYSALSGNAASPWHDGSTQTALNSIPGIGDGATIQTAHDVALTASVAVGKNATGPPSVNLTVAGTLNIPSGLRLTAHCSVRLTATTDGRGRITGGGEFAFNTEVGGYAYQLLIGNEVGSTAKLALTGNSVAPAALLTVGTVNAYTHNAGFLGGGCVELEWANVTKIGSSGTPAAIISQYAATNHWIMKNCMIDQCGSFDHYTTPASFTNRLELENNVWTNGVGATEFTVFGTTPTGAGTRRIKDNRSTKTPSMTPSTGLSVTGNVFHGAINITGYTAVAWSFNMHNGNDQDLPNTFDHTLHYNSAGVVNWHPVHVGRAANQSISYAIFDGVVSSGGDMIVGGPSSGTYTASATYCLVLANSTGNSQGELVSPIVAGYTWTADHNTVISTGVQNATNETGVAVYGEGFAGAPGMYASIKYNYVYSPTTPGCVLLRHNQSIVSNAVAPTDCDYNGYSNPILSTGTVTTVIYGAVGGICDTVGSPTVAMFTSTTGLGAHDVVAPPMFVDETRNLATFDSAYLGYTADEAPYGRGAWSGSSVSYSVGDIVRASHASFYGGAVVNFRCRSAHVSNTGHATNGQPGVVANWLTNWELATYWRMRSVALTYNASVRQPTPEDAWRWIFAGYHVQNIVLYAVGAIGIGYTALPAVAPSDGVWDGCFQIFSGGYDG